MAYRSKLEQLVEQGTHFVRWGAVLPDQPGISIGCDNFQGGQLVGEHLLGLGRKRVAFLGHASNHYPEFFDRYRGCDAALHKGGASMHADLQVDAESSEEAGYAAALALMERGRPFDALFAASDLIAIGAMRALIEHGRHVPWDVAVVGFDDIPMARVASPPLTSVIQDTSRAGELLVETLLKRVRAEPVDSVMLPPSLVVRRSSTVG
jgi:DNA-binding LacI/PurR family transcriptional regulator